MNDVTRHRPASSTPSPPTSTRVSACCGGEVAFLTATLIVIDMTIAGLFWAMSHATGQGEDVIAKLLRKVLYVGAFAYITRQLQLAGRHRRSAPSPAWA